MSKHYKNIRSKRQPDIWEKAIIPNIINIHLDSRKNYYNLMYDNKKLENENSQLHQDKFCEINSIQAEIKELTLEQMKWFDIGQDSFEHMNMQSINKWVMIAKPII